MSVELPEVESLQYKQRLINLQDRYLSNIMEARTMNNCAPFPRKSSTTTAAAAAAAAPPLNEGKKMDYRRSFSQGHSRKMFSASYFSLESLLLLICLTASLLILPLILPPLPPPPFMLLLLPICILVVLMILAFMPSNVKDITNTYV